MKVCCTATGKAAEVVEAVPEAAPEAPGPAHNLGTECRAGNSSDLASIDISPEAASTDAGPMTKAKKRKGVS